ncbi:MAG: response regulator [Acidobacteria bacterium]|nr:response regulator [Acidobacteriota bacterium]
MLPASSTASHPLVLVVEDDQGTRARYREYLHGAGFRTADAHNGYQALEKARELAPDAIVTDLAVPGIDGFELARALQQSVETRGIPIIAVTGRPEYLDEPDRFRHAGISRVLMKPCEPHVIAEALRDLLDARRGSGTGERRGFAVDPLEDHR